MLSSLLTKRFLKQPSLFTGNLLKYSRSYSSVYVNHRDTNFNNDQTPFDFTPENYAKIEHLLVHMTLTNRKDTQLITKNQELCHYSGWLRNKTGTLSLSQQ